MDKVALSVLDDACVTAFARETGPRELLLLEAGKLVGVDCTCTRAASQREVCRRRCADAGCVPKAFSTTSPMRLTGW